MTTRRAALANMNVGQIHHDVPSKQTQGKRQPEQKPNEPQPNNKRRKRAFGDITNKETLKGGKTTSKKGTGKKGNAIMIVPKTKSSTSTSSSQEEKGDVSWQIIELSQGSLCSQSQNSSSQSQSSSQSSSEGDVSMNNQKNTQLSQEIKQSEPEPDWINVDKDHMKDPFQVALYAYDIFEYYKERELKFMTHDYLKDQKDLTAHMRAILVDWLVEVQENFELNHETLYLAVKLVDQYLAKKEMSRERLQLVGATALFISCKFDERCPPMLDDFLYICDDAYKRDELILMEQAILKTIDFDLGIPLSYRFLRRYSKCGRSSLLTLTLARFILETSLMDYTFTLLKESQQAAAALYLAQKMNKDGSWDSTLIHYTGYSPKDLFPLVKQYNTMIAAPPSDKLATIRTKYSHKVFHCVANIPALRELDWDLESQ